MLAAYELEDDGTKFCDRLGDRVGVRWIAGEDFEDGLGEREQSVLMELGAPIIQQKTAPGTE